MDACEVSDVPFLLELAQNALAETYLGQSKEDYENFWNPDTDSPTEASYPFTVPPNLVPYPLPQTLLDRLQQKCIENANSTIAINFTEHVYRYVVEAPLHILLTKYFAGDDFKRFYFFNEFHLENPVLGTVSFPFLLSRYSCACFLL